MPSSDTRAASSTSSTPDRGISERCVGLWLGRDSAPKGQPCGVCYGVSVVKSEVNILYCLFSLKFRGLLILPIERPRASGVRGVSPRWDSCLGSFSLQRVCFLLSVQQSYNNTQHGLAHASVRKPTDFEKQHMEKSVKRLHGVCFFVFATLNSGSLP